MGSGLGCTSRGLRAGCTGRFSPNPNHEWLTQTATGVCPTFIAVLVSRHGCFMELILSAQLGGPALRVCGLALRLWIQCSGLRIQARVSQRKKLMES